MSILILKLKKKHKKKTGSDLLSHVLRRSTIGAGKFHDRVRNGIGWEPPAITTGNINVNKIIRKFNEFFFYTPKSSILSY